MKASACSKIIHVGAGLLYQGDPYCKTIMLRMSCGLYCLYCGDVGLDESTPLPDYKHTKYSWNILVNRGRTHKKPVGLNRMLRPTPNVLALR